MKKLLLNFMSLLFALSLSAGAMATDKEVELVYVEWSDAIASTYVIKTVLENQGYEVETMAVSAAAMWQAVATGDTDGMVCAWLPTTHSHYLEAVKDKVDDLGANLKGTKIGLVVPQYVTIDSIEELNDHIDNFDGKIIGIDPGAGIMSKTEQAMEDYGLKEFKLVEGSGATMTAALKGAVDSEEWVVVTGWTPHWKFSRWDLKYLEDPKKVYGGEERINTIVRQGLKEDMPEVYKILDNFQWETSDVQQIMNWNQEKGADPEETAMRWVSENPEKVNAWLGK